MRKTRFKTLAALSVALDLLVAGCGETERDADSFRVVLLGDESRAGVASKLARGGANGVVFSTPPGSGGVMDVADLAWPADMALIVTDSNQGPTPIVREHVLLARQLRIPTVGLLQSNADDLLEAMEGDRELLDLVELELRELLRAYELPGDTVPRFYDSEVFEPTSGPSALLKALADGRFPRRAPEKAPAAASGTSLSSEIYLLTRLEASAVQPIGTGERVSIWIDGQRVNGTAEVAAPIQPGDAATLTLRLEKKIAASPGTRFFVERDGQLVAAGAVVSLG
jgi:translation elongation factor EF-Tu-like GTPase